MVVNIVLLAMNLIVPLVILIIGIATKNHIPKNRYGSVGYRTKRSRSSQEAWEYANTEMAKIMTKLGAVMLIVSIVVSVFFIKSTENVVSIVTTVVVILQCVALIPPILGIEKKLKDRFG